MAEYAYNKQYKVWYCLEQTPFRTDYKTWRIIGIDRTRLLSDEKVEELRNARKNKKYLIFDNRIIAFKDKNGNTQYTRLRYPGINSDYIYEDISDLKLIICNGTKYLLMYSDNGCSSIGRIPTTYFINNNIVDPERQDFSVVVDYVESNAKADVRAPEYLNLPEAEKNKMLIERAKLYYNDLDDDAKLVYNLLGNYNLVD